MSVTAVVLLNRVLPLFRPVGLDPVAVAQLTRAVIVFAVGAKIVKRNAVK